MGDSPLHAAAVLDVWEACRSEVPLRRAVMLVAAAWPDRSADEWAQASIGERDRRLLRLREICFGTRLDGLATCPRCQTDVEVTFDTRDVTCTAPDRQPPDTLHVRAAGYDIDLRLPTSADLLSLTPVVSDVDGRALLATCVQQVRRDQAPCDVASLPGEVLAAIAEELSQSDPQSDVQIDLTCPGCHGVWAMPFDILAFVWSEVDEWAQRVLRQVHVLAREYGWSERDILAMSAGRRQLYLDTIES